MTTQNLLVLDNPARWKPALESARMISAKDYLSPEAPRLYPQARVFNLCRSYSYQSMGYYVSLLAEARGHRAIPSVATMRDFRLASVARSFGEEFEEVIQTSLKNVPGDRFELEIHFGKSPDRAYDRLAGQVFRYFPSPLLRAQFSRQEKWILASVLPRSWSQVPEADREAVIERAQLFFRKKAPPRAEPRQRFLYDLAVLVNPDEAHKPSNPQALEKFRTAARETGFFVETITTAEADRISEFDALFIRETTAVDHPTYRLSRLAHAEGLIVVDDPWSILRCANKIYLAELLSRARIPSPRTWVLSREDLANDRLSHLPLPCILKTPDAAFSVGVHKAENAADRESILASLLKDSELVLAQEFLPSEYDWRIGVLDHRPLFACRYYMAKGHWQIYNWGADRPARQSGHSETLHVEFAPPAVVETALKATAPIGDGLYGVDLKQVGDRVAVIEVNDNPNLDAGVEDKALGMELYRRIARSFRQRIERARS